MTGRLYRVFDADNRLLYIGSTVQPVEGRMRGHAMGTSPWYPFMDRYEVTEYPTLADARAAEVEAIRTEHPRWNIAHRSPDHPDGHLTVTAGRWSAPWLQADISAWVDWKRSRAAVVE